MDKINLKIYEAGMSVIYKRTGKNGWQFEIINHTAIPLRLKDVSFISLDYNILSFEYICPNHVSYIGLSAGRISNNDIMIQNFPVSDEWRSFDMDISECYPALYQEILDYWSMPVRLNLHPGPLAETFIFKIRNICLKKDKDNKKRKYLKGSTPIVSNKIDYLEYLMNKIFPCHVLEVMVNDDKIIISTENSLDSNVYLAESPMYSCFYEENPIIHTIIKPLGENFKIELDRFVYVDGILYDRIYSKWGMCIQNGLNYVVCSHFKYAHEVLVRTANDFPRIMPKTRKGIGDFTLTGFESDIEDLNVSYITVNFRLNDLFLSTPQQNSIPFTCNERTYYADSESLREYDEILKLAEQRDIIVSAIILVYPEKMSKDQEIGRLLEHPDYNPSGAYTMPNLTNLESFNLYVALIDFLAKRYSLPNSNGLVHKWIVHNEVDSGWLWTNAGGKNIQEYMDLYIRSMRTIYFTTRKYNRAAEVLISLAHFWHGKDENADSYRPYDILSILNNYIKAEGDFRWGVAYHAYPENMWDPKSWMDLKATNDKETEYITFKNLEVLNRWIMQPDIIFNGREKRTLLLAEQNPNTKDYTEQSLVEQAAAIAYVFKKMKRCSGIDAYIAHSWLDARFEGGLRTGLRKYPDDAVDPAGKKLSWYVFRDAESSHEDESFEFAKKIIGIENWDQI